jgi:hypothetical protein
VKKKSTEMALQVSAPLPRRTSGGGGREFSFGVWLSVENAGETGLSRRILEAKE